jgi:hypothetical protein
MSTYLTCNALLQATGEYQADVEGQGVLSGSLHDIFNKLSKNGWELMNCVPSAWNTAPADHPAFDAVGYMAIFRQTR